MNGKEKPRLKTGAHFVSGSLEIMRKTDEEQERAAQADRSVLVVRDYSSERLCRSCSLFEALILCRRYGRRHPPTQAKCSRFR